MSEILSVIATAATLIGGFLMWFRKFHKKFTDFMDDWNGEPARPGVPGRAGVMERLETIEGELKTNHGSSLRDAVKRIETTVGVLAKNAESAE